MNTEQRATLGKTIAFVAEYYGKELKREVIAMMINDLNDLPLNDVLKAYDRYRLDPKNRAMPLPAQIRGILNPTLDDDSKARDIAAKIHQSIIDFGYTRPNEAKAFIGEIGWHIVRRWGGWQYVCENHGLDLNPATFMAQTRDMVKSAIVLSNAGKLNESIGFEKIENRSTQNNQLESAAHIFKSIIATKDT